MQTYIFDIKLILGLSHFLRSTLLLATLCSHGFAQESDSRTYIGKDAQIAIADVVFEDDIDARRWRRLYACLSSRSDQTWETYPLRKIGNFAQTEACKGKNTQYGCSGGSFRSKAGSEWWELSTIHYPEKPFFGYVVNAGANPKGDGVGVSVWRSEKGRSVTGERLMIDFSLWQKNRVKTRLSIGDTLSYTIKQTKIGVPVTETREELLKMLMTSPRRLKMTSLNQLMALQKKVTSTLTNDQVLKCVYGPYKGDGIPPTCVKRVALTKRERARELKRVEIMFNTQRALVERHAPEMHAQLLKALPMSCLN